MVRLSASIAAALLCAAAPTATAQQLAQPLPAAADNDAPLPPAGAAASFVPPPHDEAGYLTPNRGLPAEQAAWHFRVALNVAALGCREATAGVDLAASYNAFLASEAAPLARAVAATRQRYRARHGSAWESVYDDDMTRLYNFFAQPPAHVAFCATAAALLDEARAVPPAAFTAFAAAALLRLEAPFTSFFAAYDGYRAALAAWRGRQPGTGEVMIATAAPVPVGPRLRP